MGDWADDNDTLLFVTGFISFVVLLSAFVFALVYLSS